MHLRNNGFSFILGMILMLAPLRAEDAAPVFDSSNWKSRATVTIPENEKAKLIAVSLTPELLAGASATLGDLRVTDENGVLVPYAVRETKERKVEAPAYPPLAYRDRSFIPNQQSSIVAKFDNKHVRNALDVITDGDNFRRRVMVEGSEQGTKWKILVKDGWLFAIPGQGVAWRMERIFIGENAFPYYRVTVFPGQGDPEKIDIKEIRAIHTDESKAETLLVAVLGTQITQNAKEKTTDIELDLGFENLHLEKVAFEFRDSDFMRCYELFGRNCKTRTVMQQIEDTQPHPVEMDEAWTNIGRGVIYRVSSSAHPVSATTLSCNGAFRYVRLRIHNRDNQPLGFLSANVWRLKQILLLQTSHVGSLSLFFGNPKAPAPTYDLAGYVDRLEKDGVTPATPGTMEPNPAYHAKETVIPWTERHQWLLTPTVLLLIIALGFLLWRQTRQSDYS